MKKGLKVILILLVVLAAGFIVLAILGNNDMKEEETFAADIIKEDIAVDKTVSEYAKLTSEEIEESAYGKHIRITGIVNKVGNIDVLFVESDFEMKCYVDEIDEAVVVGATVTLDGVCTYTRDDYMRLRLCTITNVEAPVVEIVSEETEAEGDVLEETEKNSEAVNVEEKDKIKSENVRVEEKIEQMIKEIEQEAEIEAIVETDPDWCAYKYKEKVYVVYNMTFPRDYLDDNLLARVERLETENTCDYSSGYVVFLNKKDTPDYFVESDSYKVFKLKCSLSSSGYSCYPFVDDEMILSYGKLFQDIKPIYEPYAKDVLSKQYTIVGEVIERDFDHEKLYLYGTATRYDGEEFYSGKIVLNYDEEGIDVTGDSIQAEGFFNMDDYGTIEEDGSGYRIYNTSGASVLGQQLEHLLNNIEYCEESIELLTNAESLANEQSGKYEFDIAWYETYKILKNGTQMLEIIWYDNGDLDFAINGLTLYHGNRDNYVARDDGTVVYSLNDGIELRYYPNDGNFVELVGGEYQGYYYPE